jgi:hypothetical protein
MNVRALDIKPLDKDLKKSLIDYATNRYNNQVPFDVEFTEKFSQDITSPFYVDIEKWHEKYGASGGVHFYVVPPDIEKEIISFYKDNIIGHRDSYRFIQVVTGGKYIAPHIDENVSRVKGLMHLLQADTNTQTSWYKLKDNWASYTAPENTTIPYDIIEKLESHHLKQDVWYEMIYEVIHGVEYLTDQLRIALTCNHSSFRY